MKLTPVSKNAHGPLRFVVADDHVLVRELIVTFLNEHWHAGQRVVGLPTMDAALQACLRGQVDFLLLNAQLISSEVASEIGKLRRQNPPLLVLCYAGGGGDSEIMRALQCGVDGFVGQTCDHTELLEAIRRIRQGEDYFCARSSHLLADLACGKRDSTHDTGKLTPRETQILRLIASGRTSKEIAALLGLRVATVDTHRRNLMAKAEAHNAADVVRYGYSHDLLTLALSAD